LAFTTVHFWNRDGQLAARGSHTKYVSSKKMDARVSSLLIFTIRFVVGTLNENNLEYEAPDKYVDESRDES
jgi:hypothetical protein